MRLHSILAATLVAGVACGGGGGQEPTPDVASLTISPSEPDSLFARGATVQLNAVARDANNATINNPPLTFASANTGVATVSNAGLVTAQSDGSTSITAQSGNVSASVTVRVRRRVNSVTVTPSSRTLIPGGTQTFSAAAMDANTNSIPGFTATFTSNSSAVEITAAGAARAISLGSAIITATMNTPDGTRTGTASVSVQQISQSATINLLASSFDPTSVNIAAGGTVTFTNGAAVIHNVTFSAPGIADIPDHSSGSNLRTFPEAGNFAFQCTLHPGMIGNVVVH